MSYFVGRGVGLVDGVRSTSGVVLDFMTECAEALEDMRTLADWSPPPRQVVQDPPHTLYERLIGTDRSCCE